MSKNMVNEDSGVMLIFNSTNKKNSLVQKNYVTFELVMQFYLVWDKGCPKPVKHNLFYGWKLCLRLHGFAKSAFTKGDSINQIINQSGQMKTRSSEKQQTGN